MRLPLGFSTPSPTKVYQLRKVSIWFKKISPPLVFQARHQALMNANHTLFTKHKGNEILSILVYVNDILVAGNNATLCTTFQGTWIDVFS